MGTYTTNYNLFLPTIGEQGWGTLVNENFTTIDTTMKSLSNRIAAVESEVNGALSCTSVATSGTITSSGKITGNGGIGTTSLTTSSTITSTGLITGNGGFKGNLTGNVTGKIVISSVGTNSNNLKIGTVKPKDATLISSVGTTETTATIPICSTSNSTLTKYNTSIINCTTNDNTLCQKPSATCTLKTTNSGSYSGTIYVTVKETASGSVILNAVTLTTNPASGSAGKTATTTFNRNFSKQYTVSARKTSDNGSNPMNLTVSTANGNVYVS